MASRAVEKVSTATTFEGLLRRRLDLDGVRLPEKILTRGRHLYLGGSRGSLLYLVSEGWVKTYIPTSSGKVSLIDLHGPEDMVGLPPAGRHVGPESAVSLSDGVVQMISFDQLMSTIVRHRMLPNWTDFLVARLHRQQELISGFVTLNSQKRLAVRLLMLGRRDGRPEDVAVRLPHRLTHEDLAAMVGTTRSRVGHFLATFERAGLIVRTGEGMVVFPARLRRFAEAVG